MALCVYVWESQIVHTLITEWCHSLFQTALSAKSLWSHNLVNLPEKKKQKLFKHILPAECKVFLNNLVTSQQQTHIPSLLYGTLWSSMLNKTKLLKRNFSTAFLRNITPIKHGKLHWHKPEIQYHSVNPLQPQSGTGELGKHEVPALLFAWCYSQFCHEKAPFEIFVFRGQRVKGYNCHCAILPLQWWFCCDLVTQKFSMALN